MSKSKNLNRLGLFLLVFTIFISFTSAQPSTTIYSFPNGYTIVPTQFETLKAGEDFNFFFYLYNTSSGLKIDNSTVECNFHLADAQGNLVLEDAQTYQPNGYWFAFINGSYIANTGYYYYGVDCQDGLGGAISGVFEVTLSGNKLTLVELGSNIFLIGLILLIIFTLHQKYKGSSYNESNKKISESHNGNWGKTFIKTLGNNLMRNSFLWYYSLGWLLLIVLKDVVYNTVSLEVYKFFLFALDIYSFGFFLVIIVWIGILIHHFRFITELINDLNLGVNE